MSESGVYRRQILTSKDGTRAERVKVLFATLQSDRYDPFIPGERLFMVNRADSVHMSSAGTVTALRLTLL